MLKVSRQSIICQQQAAGSPHRPQQIKHNCCRPQQNEVEELGDVPTVKHSLHCFFLQRVVYLFLYFVYFISSVLLLDYN